MSEATHAHKLTFRPYILGFIFSIIITMVAYSVVVMHLLAGIVALGAILVLAMVQLFVQLWYFLHLESEEKPYFNTIFFISTFALVFLVIVASIWIMNHLDNNMMPPDMSNPQQYLIDQP